MSRRVEHAVREEAGQLVLVVEVGGPVLLAEEQPVAGRGGRGRGARSRKPTKGATPVPGPTMTIGVPGRPAAGSAGSAGRRPAPGVSAVGVGEEGRADALPRAGRAGSRSARRRRSARPGAGSVSGLDDMEYSRGWRRLSTSAHSCGAGPHRVLGDHVHGLPAPAPLGQLVLVVRAQQLLQLRGSPGAFGDEAQQVGGDPGDVEVAQAAPRRAGPRRRRPRRPRRPASRPVTASHSSTRSGGVDRPDAERVAGLVAERGLAVAGVEGEPADLLAGAGQAEQAVAGEAGEDGGGLLRRGGPARRAGRDGGRGAGVAWPAPGRPAPAAGVSDSAVRTWSSQPCAASS